jgi:hypothetical protein
MPESSLQRWKRLVLGPRTWFLPHHGVINPQKPEKLRVVFDAATKFQGTSLNNQLVQGPDFTNNLIGVHLRFRQHQIAVMLGILKKCSCKYKCPVKTPTPYVSSGGKGRHGPAPRRVPNGETHYWSG